MTTRNLAKISDRRAAKFLTALANTRDGIEAYKRLESSFADIFPSHLRIIDPETIPSDASPLLKLIGNNIVVHCPSLREDLQRVWIAPGQRAKTVLVARMVENYLSISDKGLPPVTAFEEALTFFLNHAHLAKRCYNSDCPSPYFFAARRSQKYCGQDCSGDAQKVAKLKWWREKGKKRRRVDSLRKHC